MPASEEIVGGIPTFIGLAIVGVYLGAPQDLGPFREAAFGGGLLLMCIGPVLQGTALEHFANFNLALGATMEPWMNGKRTLYYSDTDTIANPDADSGGPQYRTKLQLVKPRPRHPKYGVLPYIYIDHDFDLGQRIRLRKGKGSYYGMTVSLKGIDGNVVLAEHNIPIVDDGREIPAYTLVRAGKDWKRDNGDYAPMERFEEEPIAAAAN